MAYISFQPTDYFNTKLYTANGSTNAITGVGFQPDFTWIKKRSNTSAHYFFDSLRTTYSVSSNTAAAQADQSGQGFTSLDSDGFTLSGTGGGGGVNDGTNTFASWNWKGGTTSVPSGGSITPSAVSINTTSKQGIYKWTGNGSAGATIAHGLGQAPKFIMVKNTGGSHDWACYHANIDTADLTQAGDYFIRLNTTAAKVDNSGYFNDTTTTDTLITLGADNPVNQSSTEIIMYAFCDVPGYSHSGTYMGNANVDGRFIYLGFEPAMLMIKRSDGTGGWCMYDDKRPVTAPGPGWYNVNQDFIQAQDIGSESDNSNLALDFLSNGFKLRNSAGDTNTNGGNFIYIAWAKNPIVGSNETPGLAR